MNTSDAVFLKRSAQSDSGRQAEYKKRVHKKCQRSGCIKNAQRAHGGVWYCTNCLKEFHPEAAAEALELRMQREPKRPCHGKNHTAWYGAPEHQPCTARGRIIDPVSEQYYCKRCLRIVSLETLDSNFAAMRVVRDSRSCYCCNLALPIDGKPYNCDCGTEARPSHGDMCDKCLDFTRRQHAADAGIASG